MEYAVVGITAFIITMIVCHKYIFAKNVKDLSKTAIAYRLFIFSVLIFYLVDAFWGTFEDLKVAPALYIDTVLFFAFIGISVFLWSRLLTLYIGGKGKTNTIMRIFGILILLFITVMLIINIFNPILFAVTDEAEYIAKPGRYSLFIGVEVLFALSGVGALIEVFRTRNKATRHRFIVISVFCAAMSVAIIFQLLFPLLPFYSIGYMVGICLINTFIVNAEMEENRDKVELLLKKDLEKQQELNSAKALAYKDSLTGAFSKFAYAQMEDEIDKQIADKKLYNFAVIVFDINGLKYINDTQGHDAGDVYIKDCYKLITDIYKNNRIYRFGGDEFVAILQDEDYKNREILLSKFEKIIDDNLEKDEPVVSTGMSEFDSENDNTYRAVFIRADKLMYDRKHDLKERGSHVRQQ